MKSRKNIKHRGEILEAVMTEGRYNISAITKKARFSRSSYYNHIRDPELPLEIFERYGRAMKHDFSEEFPLIANLRLEEEETDYNRPQTLEEAQERIDFLMEKLLKLNEEYRVLNTKYNQLLEQRHK